MTLKTTSIARLCGAAVAFLLLGCGSNAVTTNSDPAAAFAGSWTFGSGSIQPMCTLGGGNSLSIPNFDLTGDTMMVTHVSPTEVSTTLTGTGVMCNVNFTVSGSTATAETGQTCLVTVMVALTAGAAPTSIPVTIHISTWTLTVAGDTLSIAMTGTATAESGLVTCAPTADGMATRVNGGG